jgi:hypothetical protein
MGRRTIRLAGGPCDGLTRRALAGDWDGAARRAIAGLEEASHLQHIYDLASEPPRSTPPDVLVFRYRGTLAQPEPARASR